MTWMPTPNYVLTEEHTYSLGPYDQRILPVGTFIRPIELYYVPKHVRERWKYVDVNTEVFCYTFYGIIPIPKDILRKT